MEEDPVETAPHGAPAYEGGLAAMALLGTMAAVLILIGVALLKPLLAAQEGVAGTGGSDFEAQIAVPENRIATERTTLSVGSDAPRWLANARPFPLAPAQPAIAVILIETGTMRHAVGKLLSKNRNLTLALAHDFETARWRAQAARRDGHEILTLLPTEYDAVFSRHANVLGRHLGRAELQRRLGWHLAAMEVSVGAMDLGGGDILRDAGALGEAMEVLAEGGGLFIDSRSDSGSIAAPVARAQGVPVAQRTVRLEERDDPQRIASKLADAETHARRWKNAVVVVEPGEVALAGLLAWLDTRDPSITLAPVSAVVGRLRAGGQSAEALQVRG